MDYRLKMTLAIEESERKLKLLNPDELKRLVISDRLRRLRKRGLRVGMDFLEEDQEVRKTELSKFSIVLFIRQIKEIMGCKACEEKHPACIEFHHLDPKDKSFSVATAANGHISMSTLIHEIRKCILICSNCHKKEHHT